MHEGEREGEMHNSRGFLMFKVDLEKAEEPEIKLPTSTGSYVALQYI